MKHFSWILTLPLTVVVVVFSVNNIADMAINLWPFGIVISWPTYLVMLLSVVIGFLLGGTIMWVSAGQTRQEMRRQRGEARRLAHELESLRKATESTKSNTPPDIPGAPRLPATVAD